MKRFAGLLVAALAFAQTPTIEQQIGARISAQALTADVSFLASDALQGRGTPSPGLETAGEFIASQFRRAGIQPAVGGEYFQNAPYNQVTANFDGFRLSVAVAGAEHRAEAAAVMLLDPAARDLDKVPAVIAAVNDVQALTPEQVRGKVLILDEAGPRLPAPVVQRLQPALILLLPANGRPPRPAAMLREVTGAEPVPTLFVWDAEMRKVLTAKPAPPDVTVSVHIAAPAAVLPARQRNVIGILRGSDPQLADTYVMLTAHYDHLGMRPDGEGDVIFNGANDDASGVACLLEIAHALASLPERPKRSIVFMAVYGEEGGLMGSRYYARHPVFPLAKTVADLNLEQLGRTDDVTGPRVGVLNLTGFDYTSFATTLQKAGEAFGIQLQKDDKASDPFFARSDNQAFADAGIPSHTASVGYVFPDYHRVTDEWQKLDYENMAKVARTIALAAYRVADDVAVPVWSVENPKTAPYRKAREAAAP